jgi:hypothetical protein
MARTTLAFSFLCLCNTNEVLGLSQGGSRRAFLTGVPAAVAASGAAFLINIDRHDSECFCLNCRIAPASAYEMREVGGADRSGVTQAMNKQAFETNNRLERAGFKLDTRESEKARLADALSSFSYDSSSSSSKKKSGYGSKKKETSSKSS